MSPSTPTPLDLRPSTLRLAKSKMKHMLAEQVYRSGQMLLAREIQDTR